jgi:ribulose-phosphate 3-epimerase
MKCSASLWSADLANLADEIKRIEPYADRFHLDVADGQYVNNLLFFPDLVKALRPHTALPFEVHLMAVHPAQWLDGFVDAGANIFIFPLDSLDNPHFMIRTIKACGKKAGISLRVEDPIRLLDPYLDQLDLVTLMGTQLGVKGVSMDPSIPAKIAQLRRVIAGRGVRTEIEADGGIRSDTVPLIDQAGADWIVPGSLIFRGDPDKFKELLMGHGI